jgi:hypothetical protein
MLDGMACMRPVVQVDCTPVQAWYNGNVAIRVDRYKADGSWLRLQVLQVAAYGMPSSVSIRTSHGKVSCRRHGVLQKGQKPCLFSAVICTSILKAPQHSSKLKFPVRTCAQKGMWTLLAWRMMRQDYGSL